MKALLVTSLENYSGKTAILLGFGKRLQVEGHKVGYLKPVSHQPVDIKGHVADEDAAFVKSVLVLDEEPWELAPVVTTPQLVSDCVLNEVCDLSDKVKDTFEKVSQGKDVVLIEGGGSLREGYAIGLPIPHLIELLDVPVLIAAKFRGRLRLLDDVLTSQFRLGERLLAVILNRIPANEMQFVQEQAIPFLQGRGVNVVGAIPERPLLAAISVGELIDALKAKVLVGEELRDGLVEALMVGAMGGDAALSRFRMVKNKCVITGGDRVDIQLAALDTSTVCLILTGNLRPPARVLARAEEQGVTVLIVPDNTLETVEAVESVFGRTRLGQAAKLAHFEALMVEHVNYDKLFKLMELD